jgi:hypothetical protein
MTTDRVPAHPGDESLPAAAGAVSVGLALGHEEILDLCDGLLGEIGRRMHRFSWLRDPSAPIVSYLPLDSYYPGNHLVVVIAPRTTEQERVCTEEIPGHGFNLLWVVPQELGPDPRAASDRLFEQIKLLGPLPERPRERVYRQDFTRPSPSASTPRAPTPPLEPILHDAVGAPAIGGYREQGGGAGWSAPSWYGPAGGGTPGRGPAAATTPGRAPGPPGRAPAPPATASAAAAYRRAPAQRAGTRESQELSGVFFGLALAVILGAETFGLGIAFAMTGGHWLLAFGIAFDVCARGLGTMAAVREGSDDTAWAILIFGSPAAVSFGLLSEDGMTTEPAPLAGALGALACAMIGLWIVGSLLGI